MEQYREMVTQKVNHKSVGQHIKTLHTQRGYSQTEAAALIGIKQNTVSHCTRQNLEHWIWLNNMGFRSCNSIFQ